MKRKIRNPKEHKRTRRHKHIRRNVSGTAELPRACVFRSHNHIYVQIIDDEKGQTLAAASSLNVEVPKAAAPPAGDKEEEKKGKKKGRKKPEIREGQKMLQAKEVGRMVAAAAKEKGVTKICFDRGGYLYHGRVEALAQAMREGGLEF